MADELAVAAPAPEGEEGGEPKEVAVVAAVPIVDSRSGVLSDRDRGEDGVFTKFVVCIVTAPMLIISITLGISTLIAIITTVLVNSKESNEIFAEGKDGQFDQTHETTLMFRARMEAMEAAWPSTGDDPCGSKRSGFRRLSSSSAASFRGAKSPGWVQGLLSGQVDNLMSETGLYHKRELPPHLTPPPRPPVDRVPIAWGGEDGVVWGDSPEKHAEKQKQARRPRRRLDDDDDDETADCDDDGVNSATGNNIQNASAGAATSCSKGSPCDCNPTQMECNNICNVGERVSGGGRCLPMQRENNHVFVMITEAMTPCNEEEPTQDAAGKSCDDDDDANENDCDLKCADGNSFTAANLAQIRKLMNIVHDDPEYKNYCYVSPFGKCSFDPSQCKCAKLASVVDFFYPRELPPAGPPAYARGVGLLTEVLMSLRHRDPMMILQTDIGCMMQYFMYDLYESPRGTAQVFRLISSLSGWSPGQNVTSGLPDAIALLDEDIDDLYSDFYCNMTANPRTNCASMPGCQPVAGGKCVGIPAVTTSAKKFAELMCLGDGTGTTMLPPAARSQELAGFHAKEHLKPFLDFYFDKRFSPANPKSKFTRQFMQFGGPYRGFANFEDGDDGRTAVQDEMLTDWFLNAAGDMKYEIPDWKAYQHGEKRNKLPAHEAGGGLVQKFRDEGENNEDVEVTYLLSVVLFKEIFALLIGDMLLGVISFLVVGFYMWFQTGSLWISMFGMIEITISLPIAYFFYTYVFQIEYFDFLCTLSLYIVMAIGADDVFIWFDAYKQSAFEPPEISGTLETRFIWAWHKAASAMLVTSLTTCAVFCATASSPLLNIMSFGIFTAFVIFLDYIYVITWLPAATVLYNRWFEGTGFCRCNCCCAPGLDHAGNPVGPPDQSTPRAIGIGLAFAFPTSLIFSGYFFWLGGQDAIYAKAYGIGALVFFILFFGISGRIFATVKQAEKSGTVIQDWFQGPFTEFITNEKVRYGLIAGLLVLMIPLLVCAFMVGPATKEEQFLPDDHPLQKVVSVMNNEFPVSGRDEKIRVDLMFGIDSEKGYDIKDESAMFDYKANAQDQKAADDSRDASEIPQVIYNTGFDWSNPGTPQFLLAKCNELDSRQFVAADRAPDCEEDPCPQEKSTCVVKELGLWLRRNCSTVNGAQKADCKSASDWIDTNDDILRRNSSYLTDYGLDTTFNIGCAAWDHVDRNKCLGWNNTGFPSGLPRAKANRILWDFYQAVWKNKIEKGVGFANKNDPDSRVKYVFIEFSVPMKRRAYYTPSEFSNMYDQVYDYAKNMVAPSYVGKPGMTDIYQKWKWMNTQKLYLKSALSGVSLAILFALIVLCIATNNIIIAGLAVGTICCVVACVLGSMYLAGWELGNIESICLTVLAGFCVDYIVHLAHSYVECPDNSSRITRVEYSVGHMGISVLSGALTSLGASLLLFFCTLQFFSSFGAFFFGTIFLAWVWANFFFVPVLGTVGPENTTGDFIGGMCGGGEEMEAPPDATGVVDNPLKKEAAEDET